MKKISMFGPGTSFQGAYSAGTTYVANDVVVYTDKKAYKAIAVNSFSGIVPTDTAYWEPITGLSDMSGLTVSAETVASGTTRLLGAGTRKYWSGSEWILDKPTATSIRLKKVYQNCDCNCNCVCNCNCQNNQPNCGNCSDCSWLTPNNGCHCACLFQSDCNYYTGNCNCTPNCSDGNCYI